MILLTEINGSGVLVIAVIFVVVLVGLKFWPVELVGVLALELVVSSTKNESVLKGTNSGSIVSASVLLCLATESR